LSGEFPNFLNSAPASAADRTRIMLRRCGNTGKQRNILLSHRATPVNVCPAIFIVFKIRDFHEQRICVKFCVKLGKSFTETFGNEAVGRTQTYERWKRFKVGRTSTDDDPRSGRPSISKTEEIVAKVREVIRSNRRLSVHEVAEKLYGCLGTSEHGKAPTGSMQG
jgi:hypothetical protein